MSVVASRSRGAALALLAFVVALLVVWAHPLEVEPRPCHGPRAAHVDAGHAPEHHDALTCSVCLHAHAAAPAPDLAPSAPAPATPRPAAPRPAARAPEGPAPHPASPRAPPV